MTIYTSVCRSSYPHYMAQALAEKYGQNFVFFLLKENDIFAPDWLFVSVFSHKARLN
jgi:hypothetical protein